MGHQEWWAGLSPEAQRAFVDRAIAARKRAALNRRIAALAARADAQGDDRGDALRALVPEDQT